MKVSLLPTTPAGKASAWIGVLTVAMLVISIVTINFNFIERGTTTAILLGIVTLVCLAATAITGIKSVWKDKERSATVVILLIISLFFLVFMLADIVFGG
jgi:uncharacterized membrane protein